MKPVIRRIDRIEEQLGSVNGTLKEGVRFVFSAADTRMALDADACVTFLEECGLLPTGREFTVVNLTDIPGGLNAEQTKAYLRKHGAELCGSQG